MKLLIVTLVTCLALHSTCSPTGPVSQGSLSGNDFIDSVSNGAVDGACKKEDNYDYSGNDIEYWGRETTGQEDCANWCGAVKECKVWTFKKSNNWCWIKRSDAGRSKNNLLISGTKGCATGTFSVIDGGWSTWSEFSSCSATCGNATKIRTRTCSNPPPSNEGEPCLGLEEEVISCGLSSCGYVSLGCWNDTDDRAIATLEDTDNRLAGNYWERKNAVELCFEVAKSKGYPAFAVQNGGWCAASSTALETYKKYGAGSNCAGGKGGGWANDVYIIQDYCPEFSRSVKGKWCEYNTQNVLKAFIPPSSSISDAIKSRNECEEFCCKEPACWGCSLHCGSPCQFNAIPECGPLKTWSGGVIEGDVTQKPDCPDGYDRKTGDTPGWGSLKGKIVVPDRKACSDLCNQEIGCLSFEHSNTEKICNLNTEKNPVNAQNHKDYQYCSKSQVIDGGWSTWSEFSSCSATCGDATKTRTRTCSNPPPSNEGEPCLGLEEEVISCGLSSCGCHVGEMYDGNCYLLVSTPETWQDAQLGCSSRNASLASIHNAATNHFIANLAGGGGSRTWIGASDSETEGEWKWTDGNIATFSNWDRGQPDNSRVNWGGDQDCLVINFLETGKWDDAGCWRKHPYVCQGQTLSKGCESGWKQHEDKCYKVFLELLTTYTDASEKCISVQADVASLETQDENAFIKELLEQEQIPLGIDLWLSGRRQSEDSPYVWGTGEEMAYNDWSGGQPQQRSELCMQIFKNNNPTWQWYTEACNNVYQNDNGVLCEKTAK